MCIPPHIRVSMAPRFRLAIDRENKHVKEAIQSNGQRRTFEHCVPHVVTHYYLGIWLMASVNVQDQCGDATVQQPLTTVFPNSNPTIVTLQAEAEFVNKYNVVPHSIVHVRRSSHTWVPNACGFQSTLNEALDALRTFHSTANGVEWYEWTPNEA
ncbi:hypothetical protein TNCV_2467151 [Trichonephila clavipes]|nr:hypothetical protein TNCV_2467151 [Trichonephila clavipes]